MPLPGFIFMIKSSTPSIKREKKKSIFLRELSIYIDRLAQDEPRLRRVFLSRVDLSADCGICYLYFATLPGTDFTDEYKKTLYLQALDVLKLYKPSLRKNLAQNVDGRYTPSLVFMYDDKKDKIDRVNVLLDKVHEELTEQSPAASDESDE